MSNSFTSEQNIPQRYSWHSVIKGAKDALLELTAFERGLHILWLLGPFILLIERSPADIWLTTLALAFVIRAVMRGEGSFLQIFWVRAAFAFWTVCLISAAVPENRPTR